MSSIPVHQYQMSVALTKDCLTMSISAFEPLKTKLTWTHLFTRLLSVGNSRCYISSFQLSNGSAIADNPVDIIMAVEYKRITIRTHP